MSVKEHKKSSHSEYLFCFRFRKKGSSSSVSSKKSHMTQDIVEY